ncbi:APX2 [Bugula neritina]|uniref:APX2 n=1 Tax=Bugula neritina TaxID=10212 RepID=A0A7J7KAP9_BUGNE|nr:APX2 [Bugula neritina]
MLPALLLLLPFLCHKTVAQSTEQPSVQFEPLKQSDFIKAQAYLKWLINNRTENGTTSFNAGFIRLAFHDCVGGCDGCLNIRNPSNAGLNFYKTPLDLMYKEFIFPMMSRADWYALAGYTAVEVAAKQTSCTGRVCVPPMNFKWGRKDCLNESRLFRQFPGSNSDPRETIRRTFRMNLLEITALMGAHTLGKNHGLGISWVKNETSFDNQYYKDMINSTLAWRKGARPGVDINIWSHGKTGSNVMLTSDFFMGFDVGTGFIGCNNNPIANCDKSSTFSAVRPCFVFQVILTFHSASMIVLIGNNFSYIRVTL